MTRRVYVLLVVLLLAAASYFFHFFYVVENAEDMRRLNASESLTTATTASASINRRTEFPKITHGTYLGTPFVVKPLPVLNTPVIQVLDDLKSQAHGGNFRAACRLGFELDRCMLYFNDKKVIDEMRISIEKLPPDSSKIPGFQRTITKIQKAIDTRSPVCEGLPVNEIGASSSYLLQAANAGQGSSTVRYLNGYGLDWEAGPLANKEEWTKFAENFVPFLDRSINQGLPEALEVAANAHLRPTFGAQLLPLDPVKALTYLYALEQISTPGYRGVLQKRIAFLVKEHSLTSDQVAKTQANAVLISAKMIKSPPGGIDFSKGTFAGESGQHCEE